MNVNRNIFRAIFFMLSVLLTAHAGAAMNKIDSLPHFKFMQTTGSIYTYKELPKNKPWMLIYFAPDCEHCQKLMNQLFPHLQELDKVELLMVTFKPVEDLRQFEKQYQTRKYSNVVTGTEGTSFYFRYFYNIQKTPFIALYDRKGKLIASYVNAPPISELIKKARSIH